MQTTIVETAIPSERRQGNTGVWTFVMRTEDGEVLARSEWGTNYIFAEEQWNALPIVTPEETP